MKTFIAEAVQGLSAARKPDWCSDPGHNGKVAFRCALLILLALGFLGGISQAQEPLVIGPTGDVSIGKALSVGGTVTAPKLDLGDGVVLDGEAGRNVFKDIEKSDGDGLRVGSAWGMYGIWANTGQVVVGGTDGVNLQNGKVEVNTDGNVGIGTEPTANKLSVEGNANFSGNVGIGTEPTANKLSVEGNANFSGNVGIGTKAASSNLSVAGSVLINGTPNGRGLLSLQDDLFLNVMPGVKRAGISKNAYVDTNSKWQIKDRNKGMSEIAFGDDGNLTFYVAAAGVGLRAGAAISNNGDVVIPGNLFVKGKIVYQMWDNGSVGKGDYRWMGTTGDYVRSWSNAVPALPSDSRLKTDLHPIPSALEKVSQLRGVTFRWNEQGLQYLTKDIETTLSAGPGASDEDNRKLWQAERDKRYKELSKTNVGVVAQDVEAVLPQAVTTDASGYKLVNYTELIPLVIEALKEEDKISQEQARTIASQQTEIQRLTVANQAAQQQLIEMQDVKQKLGLLEATVNRFLASGLSADADKTGTSKLLAGARPSEQ